MRHFYRSYLSKTSLQVGFTIIELLVVFSIIAITSAVGIAGFSSFSKEQTLKSTVEDIRTMLNAARSYTYSQLNTCGSGKKFSGYKVYFCNTSGGICNGGTDTCRGTYPASANYRYYEMDILCDGEPFGTPIETKEIPTNIQITAPVCQSFSFQPITNVVTTSGNQNITVSYTNTSFQQTITVSQLGIIK